jgi:hypothetical protein
MNRDALAAQEDLDGARGEAGLDLTTGEAMWHRVMVMIEGDMVIEPDTASLPLRVHPGLGGQRLEIGRVDFLEQLAAGATELAKNPRLIEIGEALGDSGVELSQAVEDTVAQSAGTVRISVCGRA